MTQTLSWKLVIDSADPHAQAGFWAEALGYVVEDNSPLIERLLSAGAVPEAATTHAHGRRAWRDLAAARHPDDPYDEVSGTGHGRRLLFQRVPEPKTGGGGGAGGGGGRGAHTPPPPRPPPPPTTTPAPLHPRDAHPAASAPRRDGRAAVHPRPQRRHTPRRRR